MNPEYFVFSIYHWSPFEEPSGGPRYMSETQDRQYIIPIKSMPFSQYTIGEDGFIYCQEFNGEYVRLIDQESTIADIPVRKDSELFFEHLASHHIEVHEVGSFTNYHYSEYQGDKSTFLSEISKIVNACKRGIHLGLGINPDGFEDKLQKLEAWLNDKLEKPKKINITPKKFSDLLLDGFDVDILECLRAKSVIFDGKWENEKILPRYVFEALEELELIAPGINRTNSWEVFKNDFQVHDLTYERFRPGDSRDSNFTARVNEVKGWFTKIPSVRQRIEKRAARKGSSK